MKFLWLIGGNLIYALSQWLILVILARFFSTAEVGEYFFSLALVAPLALLFSLKLPNLVVTMDEAITIPKNVFGFRFILSLLLMLVVYALYHLFFKENTSFIILSCILFYKILEQYDDLIVAYYQKNIKFQQIFLVKTFRSISYCFFIAVSVLYIDDFYFCILIATLLYSAIWLIKNLRYIYSPFFHYPLIKYFLKNGLYLSVSSSLSSLSVSGVRLYIGYVLGSSVLAIYGVISYSLIAFSIIVSALGQYFLPLFVKLKSDEKNFYKEVVRSQLIIFSICLFFIVISYLYGDELLKIFYGDQYQNYGFYLCLIFIANLFKSSSALIGTAMTALKFYNFQLKLTLISLFIAILITPILIFNYNILGAFLSLLIANFIEWLLYIFFVRKKSIGVLW